MGTLNLVVDHGLSTGLDAGDVISHWVHAGFTGIDLDDLNELGLTSGEFILPVLARFFAFFDDIGLRVFTFLEL